MGKVLTSQEVQNILDSGNFDLFKEVEENDIFEAKPLSFVVPSSIVTDARDKAEKIWKMARVIGNIANKMGGYIVIGLDAQSTDKSLAEVVKGVNPFDQSLMPHTKHLENMISKHIYPIPKLECSWYQSKTDANVGLGAIHILESNIENQRFLVVCNAISEYKGKLFGIPVRNGDDGDWEDITKLWELMRKKPTNSDEAYARIMNRLDELTLVVDKLNHKAQPQKNMAPDILTQIKKEISEYEL